MKFLIIAQDLRVSGTSEGMVSRSFIAKLRKTYPKATIDVFYLKFYGSNDALELLPVDTITEHVVSSKVPFYIKLVNWGYWRLFHESLNERYVQRQYARYIKRIDHNQYDFVFFRSAGLGYEAVLGAQGLPILNKAIINFHDPYPVFWCAGNTMPLDKLELNRLKRMQHIVRQAKACITPAKVLTRDMGELYKAFYKFYTLPHQYDASVFHFDDQKHCFKKRRQATICYQGAIQFGRNICVLLDAYKDLVRDNDEYRHKTEFIVRVKKTIDINNLSKKYQDVDNIVIMGPATFSESSFEQRELCDINIILDNGPERSNILVGKSAFLASVNKPVLVVSPGGSELRTIIEDLRFIVGYDDSEAIKLKLEVLIKERLRSKAAETPFGDYFSNANFKKSLDKVLLGQKEA